MDVCFVKLVTEVRKKLLSSVCLVLTVHCGGWLSLEDLALALRFTDY